MDTSRGDFGIAIRSALLQKGTQQRFSLLVLVLISIVLIFFETIEAKPLNFVRAFIKDTIYRGSLIVSSPAKGGKFLFSEVSNHINLYKNYSEIKEENIQLKNKISENSFLDLENKQLKKLLKEQIESEANIISSRVMLDKQSPYLNSFIINSGSNKNIKNGMAVLHGKNFVGRIVDVNFFSSRVLLITDLNSKIPVVIEPTGNHAILSGKGKNKPVLEYLPENNQVKEGDKVFTSGKEGIFSPGIPIGEVANLNNDVSLFSETSQITFVSIKLGKKELEENY